MAEFPGFALHDLDDLVSNHERRHWLFEHEEIVFNACTHTEAIKMKYSDFARLVHPTVAKLRMP